MAAYSKLVRSASRRALVSIGVWASAVPMSGTAFAVSLRVQLACATDYYAHCSAYSPTSPQVRSCMRAVGVALSKRCVDALVAAGEVSSAEVSRRRGASETAAR